MQLLCQEFATPDFKFLSFLDVQCLLCNSHLQSPISYPPQITFCLHQKEEHKAMSHAIETLQDGLENPTIAQPSLSVAARRDRERAIALSLCNHHPLNQPLFNANNISQSIATMSLTSTRPPAKPTPVFFIFHAVDKHRGSTFDYDAVVWRLKPGIKKVPTQFCCNIGQHFAHAVC